MFDIDEIMKRAREASENASKQLNESMEKSKKIAEQNEKAVNEAKEKEQCRKQEAENQAKEQMAANEKRQVEILGQMFNADEMAQMASAEALMQQSIKAQVTKATAQNMEDMMEQLFGEDMAMVTAALETLAMEEDNDELEMEEMNLELEQKLYTILDEKLRQIDALPEQSPVYYTKKDHEWCRFGILLSGIISQLNDHQLDELDVEIRIPVMEQQILSLIRRSWNISDRGDLLDTLNYLISDGYVKRYQQYCDASNPELLYNIEDSEEDCESIQRGWRFAQNYKTKFNPSFLTGWDIGRAAMLTRWGYFLGWLSEEETYSILNDLSLQAANELHS